MFYKNSIRSILSNRFIITNQPKLNLFKFSNIDRQRKDLLEKFDETNSDVYNQLKKLNCEKRQLDWTEIRNNLIKEHPRSYNNYNFEVQFMQHLLKIGNPEDEIIKSFTDHVKNLLINQNNKVVQCHLIRFILTMEKRPDVVYIKDALERISKDQYFIKYPVIGKAWAEFAKLSPESCKQSIDFAKNHLVLQCDALDTLSINCLKHRMFEDVENLLTIYKEKRLSDQIVEEWMKSLLKIGPDKRSSEFDRFVKILWIKRFLYQKSMLKRVEKFLHSCGYSFKSSSIDSDNCSCKECGSPMETISQSEIEKLQIGVDERLINKQDKVYIISTPIEVEKFKRFMNSHSSDPFNLVIDGLNVSYYNTSRTIEENKKTNTLSIKNLGLNESLYETIEINDIFKRYKKILVIGRKHMANWSSILQLRANHPDQVWIYLLDNKSEDDVFTIAAAISSLKTYIWTADFMRQYKGLLGSEYGDLFEKWKYCRQIRFAPGSKRILEFPINVDYVCQSNGKGNYHFPINMNIRVDSQERISAHWMCIGKSAIR
ncbi:mitochondrial ribonuclease P catalytic subunit-like [Panonychus citri]|uniref:mitochondrial ribonuclease P catalytic subunit-like n=1 Tax=Panonychus citri TaxID=50023 RepID=UPI0023070C43|nr:mitochondrial ribonuclease P catalytic subunit-like [Panonychus citri]